MIRLSDDAVAAKDSSLSELIDDFTPDAAPVVIPRGAILL